MAKQKKTPTSPAVIAHEFSGKNHVVFYLGTFYTWDGTIYRRCEPGKIDTMLKSYVIQDAIIQAQGASLSQAYAAAHPRLISEAVKALQQDKHVFLDGDIVPPTRIGGGPERAVVFQNGVLNVDQHIAGDPAAFTPYQPKQHDPALFATVALEFDYDPAAQCQLWQDFVAWMTDCDKDTMALLQEFIGWGFIRRRLEKALFLVGPGRNGKSVFLSVIHKLVGDGGASTVPLERFGDRFALISTIGKFFNIVADCEELTKVQEGWFKEFISEEAIAVEEKFKPQFKVNPSARLIVACNHLPHFKDRSMGTWRRLLIVPCRNVPCNEDPTLPDQLAAELPGIFNWAMAGAKSLVTRGHFQISKVVQDAVDDARVAHNPTRQYVDEKFVAGDPDHYALKRDLVVDDYQQWMDRFGHKPLGLANLMQELQRALGGGVRQRRLGARGCRDYHIAGLRWRDAEEREQAAIEEADKQFADSQAGGFDETDNTTSSGAPSDAEDSIISRMLAAGAKAQGVNWSADYLAEPSIQQLLAEIDPTVIDPPSIVATENQKESVHDHDDKEEGFQPVASA